MNKSRRNFILTIGAAIAMAPISKIAKAAEHIGFVPKETGNFKYIYGNEQYRKEFYDFLVNVFHLYPEEKMNELLLFLSKNENSDKGIYIKGQEQLPSIKPLLADATYALPALIKQKKIIADQTAELLDKQKNFTNYLEIGSNGRYLDKLENKVNIEGDIFFLSPLPSTFSPFDIVDRGQLFKAGKDIELNDYRSGLDRHIPKNSLDLVTVYIGFHHCPVDLREEFITSIRDAMSDNGVLIIRDHNANSKKMLKMVALAHDVFNMGTNQSWDYNHAELRNFYSLAELEEMLNKYGFKTDGRQLYQKGDPTHNSLMMYKKS